MNPILKEDEELLEIKKELSRKEKVSESLEAAKEVFNYEHLVSTALDTLDVDSSFFDDTMNELRSVFDSANEKFLALDDLDIEIVKKLGVLHLRTSFGQNVLHHLSGLP